MISTMQARCFNLENGALRDRKWAMAFELMMALLFSSSHANKACVGNFLRLLISPIWAETPSKIVQINNHHAEAELARGR